MPVDPDKYKQDSRSPQELAKAILDHQLTPSGSEPYSVSFREQLLIDYGKDHHRKHPVLGKYVSGLVWTLKAWEEGSLPDHLKKRAFSHALQVIDAYKHEAAQSRDDAERDTTGINGQHAEFHQRAAAEEMESQMVAISNLKSIENLVRTLAGKLGVSLIEPTREK